ncbi:PDZ domain-containing protein [Bacteroidota bacterium]
MKKIFSILLFITVLSFLSLYASDEARLLRFPAIYGDQIVFSYAGDLFTVDADGGVARKLTSHKGYEMFPRFSPDGSKIAFTGQYDGNTEVFIMPALGGSPKRLTHTATLGRDNVSDRAGPNNIVMDWTPDGKYITYRSRQFSGSFFVSALFKVPAEGGMSEELPLLKGGFHSWSPDGSKIAYNRVFREFRTWKYYRGGQVDEIWIHDFNTRKTEKITDNDVQDVIPMWAGDEIYFLSDRDRTMNLFVHNLSSGETTKLTDFTDFDVKFPSLGERQIVFENAGYIYKMDIETKKYEKVSIQIANDNTYSRTELKDASKNITALDLSPNGERVVLSARGEVFSLPAENGITRNLSNSPGAHEQNANWSPDGKFIAYFSDQSGEMEVYIQSQDGKSPAVQLTSGGDTYLYDLKWSPDSKKILFSDRKLRLRYVDIDSKEVSLVKASKTTELNDFDWSPDSKWIAFVEADKNEFNRILLFQTETGKTYPVTDNWYDSRSPRFSPDGKYLYFSSARDFNPTYSRTEWNHSFSNMSRIYLVTLAKDTPSPFALENDEVKPEVEKKPEANEVKGKGKKDDDTGTKEETGTRIDTEGIKERIIGLPVKPLNYFNIDPVEGKVYYNSLSSFGGQPGLNMFDLESKKENELGSGMLFTISANNKKMLVKKGNSIAVINLPSDNITLEETVDLSDMKVLTNYPDEWKQIFDESWRQLRDFFYVENMHGVDWKAMHAKYDVLVPYANHRYDLTYIIGEMIGELNIGHTYVTSPSDLDGPERIQTGQLGAKISKHTSGYFRIDHILEGANWDNKLRSPLTEVGVDVKKGDFILAVNGKSTKEMPDIYASLLNAAGKTVELTVNGDASETGSRKVLVKPIANEGSLYYYNWVQNNIRIVEEATNGQIGYMHIPDMGPAGLREFAKYFYPQLLNKKGMIIDDRGNGGGNVSPMIIERLRREMGLAAYGRGFDYGTPKPAQMIMGPKVLLINQEAGSDGDLFAYQFKHHKLGTVIGTRTWGGVVGYRGSLPFIDGGSLNKPEVANTSAIESKWVMEGYGVDPDIYIENDPAREYDGIDDQLNKAIEVIMGQLDQYKPVPPWPADPDKTGN